MTPPIRAFDPRPIIALLLVPIVGYGASAAHYGMRAVEVLYLTRELGWDLFDAYSLYGSATWAMLGGAIAAAVVGVVIGGWGTTVVGLCCVALGIAGMAVLPDPTAAFLLAAVGRGMTSVGLLAVLADAFRGRRNWLLVAGLALLYASVNIAGLVSPLLAGEMGSSSGFAAAFGFNAAVAGVAAFLALAGGVAWHLLARRFPEPDPRRSKLSGPPHLLALALILIGVPALVLSYQALDLSMDLSWELSQAGVPGSELMLNLNPGVVIPGALMVAMVAIGLHLLRAPSRPLVFAGVGGVVVGVSVVVGLLAAWPPSASDLGPVVGAVGLCAVGEVLLASFVFAGLARDLHWRLVTPLAALWRAGLIGVPALLLLRSGEGWVDPATGVPSSAWVLPPGLVVLGIVFVLAGLLLARFWRSLEVA